MSHAQVVVGQHLLVPGLGREACVKQEARWRDEHDLLPDGVGGVHEQVVDRRVAGPTALGLSLVGRVSDDDVKLLAHVQALSVSMSSTTFCRSSGSILARSPTLK